MDFLVLITEVNYVNNVKFAEIKGELEGMNLMNPGLTENHDRLNIILRALGKDDIGN